MERVLAACPVVCFYLPDCARLAHDIGEESDCHPVRVKALGNKRDGFSLATFPVSNSKIGKSFFAIIDTYAVTSPCVR